MPANNVFFPVSDPDALLAGTHPAVPFAASHVQLYRFGSQANARDGVSGTLVATFTLIAASEARTDDSGPFRFGTYDSGLAATSWYAYRFRDSGSLTFSTYSAPWQPGGRLLLTLGDLILLVAQIMGIDGVHSGTATAGSATTATCTALFKSVLRDSSFWEGSWFWVQASTDGNAPEDEEALIAEVDPATGIATFDSELTSAVGNGDVFLVLPLFSATQAKLAINSVRRQMKTIVQHEIAMDMTQTGGSRYPLPQGCYQKGDIARARWWTKASNTAWDYVNKAAYDVEFDGSQAWLVLTTPPLTDILVVEHKLSYYELEGPLTALTDSTKAQTEWLVRAAAWWLYSQLDRGEEAESTFARLAGITRAEVAALTGLHEPVIPAPLNTGRREFIGPAGAPI